MPNQLPKDFSRLAWANLAAQAAEQLSLATVPLVAVIALGAGPDVVGMLGVAQILPFLLLSIPIGLLADRISRQTLMVFSEFLRAATLIGLLVAVLTGSLSLSVLLCLGFLGAVGTVGFSVAAPAIVPSLLANLPREALATANARLELARSAAFAAGPALAGSLVAWAGASPAFVLAAILSSSAALLLLRINEPARGAIAPRKAWLVEIREGATFVWGNEYLKPILLTSVAWNISWFVLQAAYVPHAIKTLGFSASTVGFTLACYGAGMVVGAVLCKRLVARTSFGQAISVGPAFSVLAALVMAGTILLPSGLPSAIAAALSFFLFGVGPIVWTITSTTLRQTATPNGILARVSAIFLTAGFGARPIGAGIGAVVGLYFGGSACLVVALLGFLVQLMIIYRSKVKRLNTLSELAQTSAPG